LKVHLRLDNSEDADPASSTPFGDILSAAGGVFEAALRELPVPEGGMPGTVEISVSLLTPGEMEEQNSRHRGLSSPPMSSPSPSGRRRANSVLTVCFRSFPWETSSSVPGT